ncbi:hypothetical protein BDP55DRAFT_645578, partial [Colletotrichum godetiae]
MRLEESVRLVFFALAWLPWNVPRVHWQKRNSGSGQVTEYGLPGRLDCGIWSGFLAGRDAWPPTGPRRRNKTFFFCGFWFSFAV